MRRTLVLSVVAALLAGCAGRAVAFPNATPEHPRLLSGWQSRPDGAGPFPAVVLLHGCHGISSSTVDWAKWFTARGHVALIVDSWAPRAMTEGCSPESPDVPASERFDDVVGALRHLHAQPHVDRERIGVIGWSHGGVFAMSAVNGPSLARQAARGVTLPAPGFRAAVGVYPGGCFSLVHEQVIRPLLLLVGSDDDWTPAGVCAEMVAAMRAKGAPAEIVVYPGVVHYFDVEGQARTFLADVVNRNRVNGCCGATVGYDPVAAADARARVETFFGYYLNRPLKKVQMRGVGGRIVDGAEGEGGGGHRGGAGHRPGDRGAHDTPGRPRGRQRLRRDRGGPERRQDAGR